MLTVLKMNKSWRQVGLQVYFETGVQVFAQGYEPTYELSKQIEFDVGAQVAEEVRDVLDGALLESV